ncbi:DNA mismatch repair protein MutS [Melghiribacillus thermohalophilus]|uniref:DNA mismatch repair protein MutS n=1 Tax=Melghiribacillus thermohalophilus TaxID=1324956 RepID=A0A4R3NAS2_9BACI|nr:DNA mismatch repair protein MutS [Melghiribacillus thermohalophilus]TCT26687.1 DNA mismatch repair protein MutS [Melghiribacillus thermohalophilus]
MAEYTPMIQQYLNIKSHYKDAFLFFRLGDFYEMFFDDAIQASRELEITLTQRDGGKEKIPMCGVPYHSAQNYIKTLIDRGYKVAICEQVEDPKQAKGVVRREVVQLITPGTVMEDQMLDEKENNYLVSITPFPENTFVIAYNDLTTGENSVSFVRDGWDAAVSELYNLPVKEIVVPSDFSETWKESLLQLMKVTVSFEDETAIPEEYQHLLNNINEVRLQEGFGRLFQYILRTQKRSLSHMQPAVYIEIQNYMKLDLYSKRNLEITETIRKKGKEGSLLWVLDHTVTAMGSRLLKKWLDRPLLDRKEIEKRHAQVEGMMQQFLEREALRESLDRVYDLERLSGRVSYGNVNARDLIQLKKSLGQIPAIRETLRSFNQDDLNRLADEMNPLTEVKDLLEKSIMDDPPLSIKEGGIIKDGFNEKLDEYRDASRNGKKWIAEFEQKEREKTGIKSLKVGYNKVFGYYIEVTKANLHLLPEGMYERKQTLTNAERYISPELKEKETLILEAEEKSVDLEYEIFIQIREQIKRYIPKLQKLAEQISQIDVLQSFAAVSEQNQYTKPSFTGDATLRVKNGRHPVVEQVMNDGAYVPNDVYMDSENFILLITGPNMAGKSTYMRQVALTILMAQIGCFVPASEADLPIFDQIFTRIGAADDLVAGQSTFMVEMLEANHAISHATENSLILLDEIGRGTSTYDGMALAQAIIEYIHKNIGAKTLFSTHYHELTSLEESLTGLKNIHVKAEEHNGEVVFLHKIRDGSADESYGIHVAKLAGLPMELIQRANQILHDLEQTDTSSASEVAAAAEQLSFFTEEKEHDQKPSVSNAEKQIISELKQMDLLEMTPLDALNQLYKLQKKLK